MGSPIDKNSRGTQSLEDPTFCEICLLDLYQVLTVNTGERLVYASSRGREKGTILKYTRAFCSLPMSVFRRNY